jgi:hypothetical protein
MGPLDIQGRWQFLLEHTIVGTNSSAISGTSEAVSEIGPSTVVTTDNYKDSSVNNDSGDVNGNNTDENNINTTVDNRGFDSSNSNSNSNSSVHDGYSSSVGVFREGDWRQSVAEMTQGFTGADMSLLVQRATLLWLEEKKSSPSKTSSNQFSSQLLTPLPNQPSSQPSKQLPSQEIHQQSNQEGINQSVVKKAASVDGASSGEHQSSHEDNYPHTQLPPYPAQRSRGEPGLKHFTGALGRMNPSVQPWEIEEYHDWMENRNNG